MFFFLFFFTKVGIWENGPLKANFPNVLSGMNWKQQAASRGTQSDYCMFTIPVPILGVMLHTVLFWIFNIITFFKNVYKNAQNKKENAVALQQEGLGIKSWLGVCSPSADLGSLQVLWIGAGGLFSSKYSISNMY